MSRYYDIQVGSGLGSGSVSTPGSTLPPFTGPRSITTSWTSFPNGINDPGALQVEFDFFSVQAAQPTGMSTIIIHGVGDNDLQQASQYAGLSVSVKGGMQAGLPLATPGQSGTILQGQIQQGFGNRQGTERALTLFVNPNIYPFSKPGKFAINWPKGGTLKDALTTALNVAYPNYKNSVLISDGYVNSFDTNHSTYTFDEFTKFIFSITKKIKPPGVSLTYLASQNLILAYDGLGPPNLDQPKQLVYTDLIGQPTWIDSGIVQFTTVMRADIAVNSQVLFPTGFTNAPGSVGINPGQNTQQDRLISFSGAFRITSVRQLGNFRDSNGGAWATVFEGTSVKPAAQ